MSSTQQRIPALQGANNGQVIAGLELLFRAYQRACEIGGDRWQFAVNISELDRLGLTLTDIRQLVDTGMANSAEEVTYPDSLQRQFRQGNPLLFTTKTCFVLSEGACRLFDLRHGDDTKTEANGSVAPSPNGSGNGHHSPHDEHQILKPHWDGGIRELWVRHWRVKRLRRCAPAQETVLNSFEEDDWPHHIDDPLPPVDNQDPRSRLHNAIRRLNENHEVPLIRFHGDGTGEGVIWEWIGHIGDLDSP